MPAHLRRAVWLLGLCQCVLWGVLYYSFSVLLVPMEQALGLSRTAVAGAFSAGLLAMALLAPAIGRWLDAGYAAHLTRMGMGLAVAGLLMVIVSYAAEDGVSLDVGFYYMANAMGRLLGTVLSGWVFQVAGLGACLVISAVFVGLAALISMALPRQRSVPTAAGVASP